LDPVYGESDEEKSTAWEKYWLASFLGPAVFGRQTATLADPTTHHATILFTGWDLHAPVWYALEAIGNNVVRILHPGLFCNRIEA